MIKNVMGVRQFLWLLAGFFDKLVEFLDFVVRQELIKPEHRNAILMADNPDQLIHQMRDHQVPPTEEWINLSESSFALANPAHS